MITSRQTQVIADARENLRNHIENDDVEIVNPTYIRSLAFAYLDPVSEPITTLTIENASDSRPHKYLHRVVRHEAHLELNRRRCQEVVRLSHVLVSDHAKRPLMPALPKLGHLPFHQNAIAPNDESLMLEYSSNRTPGFAVLDNNDDYPLGRLKIAERLLELPDHPTYIDLAAGQAQ